MPKFSAMEAIRELPSRLSREMMFSSEEKSTDSVSFSRADLSVGSCRIKVLLQNMWGLPVLSSQLSRRSQGMCRILLQSDYDIIVFTEVWSQVEREELIVSGRENALIYFHYFETGMGLPFWPNISGTGLLILSKYPIVDSLYHRFSVNGDPLMLHHSDYYGAKGVGLARIWTNGGPIDLYASHPQASYTEKRTDYYDTRVSQSFEIAQFIRHTARSPLILLAGDLNSTPHEITTRLLLEMVPQLRDSWTECHPESITMGSTDNTFPDRQQRIDYIYYIANGTEPNEWKLCNSEVMKFYTCDSRKRLSISDHFGISAVFDLSYETAKDATGHSAPSLSLTSADPFLSMGENAVVYLMEAKDIIKNGILQRVQRRFLSYLRFLFSVIIVLAVVCGEMGHVFYRSTLVATAVLILIGMVQFLYGKFFLTDEIQSLKEVFQEISIYILSVDDCQLNEIDNDIIDSD